jgi:lipoprotein-anchoring transpeptidase ErfK/SrfK
MPRVAPPQAFIALAALAAAGFVYSTLLTRPAPAAAQHSVRSAPVDPSVRPAFSPESSAARRTPPQPKTYLVVRPARGHELVVRAAPGGPVVVRLGSRTEFGSPQTLAVARRRGPWLGVVTTHRPNGTLGWVDSRRELAYSRTRVSLVLDRSARRLELRNGVRVLRRMTVGVGRPSSPTPLGRFAVTDKLSGGAYGPYYGCCIIALSAHQPSLPAGWRGGDRIAIHGTNDPVSIGAASSAGCPHARDADLRVLMRRVPLGTPIFVRR